MAPAIIAVILGPLAEQHLRRALAISQGDWSTLVTSPVAAALLGLASLAVLSRLVWRRGGSTPEAGARSRPGGGTDTGTGTESAPAGEHVVPEREDQTVR